MIMNNSPRARRAPRFSCRARVWINVAAYQEVRWLKGRRTVWISAQPVSKENGQRNKRFDPKWRWPCSLVVGNLRYVILLKEAHRYFTELLSIIV